MTERKIENATEVFEQVNEIAEKELTPEELLTQFKGYAKRLMLGIAKIYDWDEDKRLKVVEDVFKQIAESGLSLKEIGNKIYESFQTQFDDILNAMPKNRVLTNLDKTLMVAMILDLYEPIEDFSKSEEKYEAAVRHICFIDLMLRAKKVHFNGCKMEWDYQDDLVRKYKEGK